MTGALEPFWKRKVFNRKRLDVRKKNVVILLNGTSDQHTVDFICHIKDHLDDRYNVICISRAQEARCEPSLQGFHHLALADIRGKQPDERLERLATAFRPLYVLAFGLENTDLVAMLEWRRVPVVAILTGLLDDADSIELDKLVYTATKLAFPAPLIYETMTRRCPSLRPRQPSHLPLPALPANPHIRSPDISAPGDKSLVIVGHGPVDFQGGLDLFISVVARLKTADPSTPRILFAWWRSSHSRDEAYHAFCLEQMRLAELDILIVHSADQLEAIRANTCLCLLTSRLNIFPDTALAAAMRGDPVVCFAGATSLARLFADAKLDRLVAPYLDVDEAVARLQNLVNDRNAFDDASRQLRAALSTALAADTLAERVDSLGLEAAALTRSFDEDYATIKSSGAVDDDFYFGVEPRDDWRDATREYLHANKIAYPVTRADAGLLVRRPLPGFHPLVYASHRLHAGAKNHEGALAHYIRAGCPVGPWRHRVLDMRAIDPGTPVNMRIAIHAHFHYPELLKDFLDRLRFNRTSADLFLTTTSNDRKDALDHQLRQAGMAPARIDVVPNVGRDVGPLLWILKEDCLSSYDLIGHVHGKRSVQLGSGKGDGWRTFLWENLIGGETRAMDIIAETFASDSGLGLVFAEENTLTGWDKNMETCRRLLEQIGVRTVLPDHFDFPVGTMFWARPAALEPLRKLDVTWSDYPPEPIADDGTLLHALERVIPFVTSEAGFDYATTYVRGISH